MTVPLFVVDAFSSTRFGGNAAAVCLLEEPADESWMQQVADEMNLAETAFLHPEFDAYRLRWFTPCVEVDLCGHATLAAAHVLWETGWHSPGDRVRFQTRSGVLAAERRSEWIELDFPALHVRECEPPPGLLEALGASPRFVGTSGVDYLCELESEREVRALRPDIERLRTIPTRGVMATARPDRAGCDFVSRFFAPSVGIPEDPVTGSAHCALGPYWAERLGKATLVGYQVSRRGGEVRVALQGERVRLAGRAITVVRGELTG